MYTALKYPVGKISICYLGPFFPPLINWPGRTLIIQEILVHMIHKKLFKICIRETVSLWFKKNISSLTLGYYITSEQFF